MIDKTLVIPTECVRFIRWQVSRFRADLCPDVEEVKRRYAEKTVADFEGMEPYLPERVGSILEIGCGMGAIQVLLQRRYPGAHVSLLDGTGAYIVDAGLSSETGVGGYNAVLSPYNSRVHTELLLSANGAKVDEWLDVYTREPLQADLVLSMASWGFHYPFSTYRAEGFVVCDLRKGYAEAETLAAVKRAGGKCLLRSPKADRWAWHTA